MPPTLHTKKKKTPRGGGNAPRPPPPQGKQAAPIPAAACAVPAQLHNTCGIAGMGTAWSRDAAARRTGTRRGPTCPGRVTNPRRVEGVPCTTRPTDPHRRPPRPAPAAEAPQPHPSGVWGGAAGGEAHAATGRRRGGGGARAPETSQGFKNLKTPHHLPRRAALHHPRATPNDMRHRAHAGSRTRSARAMMAFFTRSM
jgi:hypothetical protein